MFEKMEIPAVYIHVPFCQKVCPFCSFAVVRDDRRKHARYFDLLAEELALFKKEKGIVLSGVRSVYFGGGSPSRLSGSELERLVAWLHRQIAAAADTQWSIEINPEDVSLEYARILKGLGFSRASLGVQSFSRSGLRKLGRTHTPEQSRMAIGVLREAGFKDLNLDLMFAYPGQSHESLVADLEEFVQLNPTHLSVYCLNIEEKTAIYRKSDWKRWQSDNEDLIARMYKTVVRFLEANGFRQYEISNFAKKGYRSRQNLLNWSGRNYLGIGMGAHSLLVPNRWGNFKRWVDYNRALESGRLPHEYCEVLDETAQRDEELMIGLRLSKGLNLSEFSAKYGIRLSALWREKLGILRKNHLARIEKDNLILTVEGMLLADEIAASLAALIP
ncbi:MAG: radical SAM family heme chaperone HemW [Proteobacteria bacterium]|nr:radical SAM family heme chaperone HemW [Pseudomonadota bacterium]